MTNQPIETLAAEMKAAAGHCDDPAAWAEFSARYGPQVRGDLCGGHMTDFALANAQYMVDRRSLDLGALQTAAKDRIRWLSVQLAQAEAKLVESEAREGALRGALAKREEDLTVIHRAAAHCQGKFGGRMSEVDRIFQEIVRVSSMHKRRAVATPQEGQADA